MVRYIQQEICNVPNNHLNQKINLNDRYMKMDPPMWIAVVFKSMNIPLEFAAGNDFMEKLFVNKSVALSYKIKNNLFMITYSSKTMGTSNILVKILLNGL